MIIRSRPAILEDVRTLAELNRQLIQDEGHRNPMNAAQLEDRLRGWLVSGEYRTVLFEQENQVVAYGLFRETEAEIHLRQFFVVRHCRRQGIGRRAMEELLSNVWPSHKRLTVSVLVRNQTGIAFWRAMGFEDYDLTLEIMPGQRRLPPRA